MELTTRRKLLVILARVPVLATIAGWSLFGRKVSVQDVVAELSGNKDQEHDRKLLAVRVLRFINTVERSHFETSGSYVQLAEIGKSELVEELIKSKAMEKAGLGLSLFSTLRFDEEEIVPGWRFALRLKGDRLAYVATISDSSEKLGAYASDQKAVIHEGASIAPDGNGSEIWDSASLLLSGSPIEGHAHSSSFARFFRTVAFGTSSVLADAAKCCQSCPCGGNCQDTFILGQCTNCGCTCCVWCCHVY